ncbi:aminotransferase class IV family protein [bacterium]|nr:aminotransferase class IV family protein [bacterium]
MYFILNGKLVESKKAVIPITDHGFLYGDGIYETMRTKNGKLWLFNEHIKRLNNSAKEVGIKVPYKKADIFKQIILLMKKNKIAEARIRLTLSRGSNDFNFGSAKTPTFLVEAKKLTFPPKEFYKKGISVVTYNIERPMAQLKSTSMLPSILAYRYAKKKHAYEALLVDCNNRITECSMSNVFFVKKGKLITPKDDILKGTVRGFIIKKTKVKLTVIKKKDLSKMDEAFITGTVKGILPITKIDGKKVGNGKIGKVTSRLMETIFPVTITKKYEN